MPTEATPPISIQLNGEAVEAPAGERISELLERLGREPRAVAVEHNGDVLPRDRYADTRLAAGDRLEIVQFVQGG